MSIRWALHEDLVQLYQEDDRLTFVNMRGLAIKMQQINKDLFIISDTEKINVLNLVSFIRLIKNNVNNEI